MNRIMTKELLQPAVLLLFMFPLFFQLSGSIFVSQTPNFDSGGNLLQLPLPIASFFCFVGIAISLRLGNSHYGTGFVFSFFIMMVLSAVITSGNSGDKTELAKFIHLVQFILPSFALVLGRLYVAPSSDYLRYESLALYVLLFIIPLSVIATALNEHTLSPNIFVFSLYQYAEYLPEIFIGFFFLAASSLYRSRPLRLVTLAISPWMGIYAVQSLSLTSSILLGLCFSVLVIASYRNRSLAYVATLSGLFLAAFLVYTILKEPAPAHHEAVDIPASPSPAAIVYAKKRPMQTDEYQSRDATERRSAHTGFSSTEQRLEYWRFYLSGAFESPEAFLFGHQVRRDRNIYPSAHNYYLDLAYNFGFLALIPILYLIYESIRLSYRTVTASRASSRTVILITVVFFFALVDNALKVGFSQPYPGMLTFFLWGIMLGVLSDNDDGINGETRG